MIEAGLAELVDDHGGIGERRVADQAVEQRGLAGAEEAGQHGERDRLGRTELTSGRRRAHRAWVVCWAASVLVCDGFGAGFAVVLLGLGFGLAVPSASLAAAFPAAVLAPGFGLAATLGLGGSIIGIGSPGLRC